MKINENKMSMTSGRLEEDLTIIKVGLKRCGGGMSSPSLAGSSNDPSDVCHNVDINGGLGVTGCLPRTHSMSALRSRPPRRAIFWEQQCFESPTKRD